MPKITWRDEPVPTIDATSLSPIEQEAFATLGPAQQPSPFVPAVPGSPMPALPPDTEGGLVKGLGRLRAGQRDPNAPVQFPIQGGQTGFENDLAQKLHHGMLAGSLGLAGGLAAPFAARAAIPAAGALTRGAAAAIKGGARTAGYMGLGEVLRQVGSPNWLNDLIIGYMNPKGLFMGQRQIGREARKGVMKMGAEAPKAAKVRARPDSLAQVEKQAMARARSIPPGQGTAPPPEVTGGMSIPPGAGFAASRTGAPPTLEQLLQGSVGVVQQGKKAGMTGKQALDMLMQELAKRKP